MTTTTREPPPQPENARPELARHEVDPARLDHGTWCHRAGKTIGQGDIAASYIRPRASA